MNSNERPAWSIQTKIIVVVLALLGMGYAIYQFRGVITPFILAVVLAYVLGPLVISLQKRLRLPRGVGILLVYLVLFVLIAAVLALIVPGAIREAGRFASNADSFLNKIHDLVQGKFAIGEFTISGEDIFTQLVSSFKTIVEPLVGTTFDLLKSILSSLTWIVFIVIISIYLILDSEKISAWLERLPPPAERGDFIHLKTEMGSIWQSFFRGQLLLTVVVSTIITIEGMIIGMPYPLYMGILAGLLEFFPSIGHGIWLVIASLVALLAGSTWLPVPNWAFWLILLGCHIVFTQFDLNYLIPRIIGRSVHLSPLVVILGILAGASLAGVLGVVLAAPTIASLRVLARYIYARLLDLDPFAPGDVTEPLPPPNPEWWRIPLERRSKWVDDRSRSRFPKRDPQEEK